MNRSQLNLIAKFETKTTLIANCKLSCSIDFDLYARLLQNKSSSNKHVDLTMNELICQWFEYWSTNAFIDQYLFIDERTTLIDQCSSLINQRAQMSFDYFEIYWMKKDQFERHVDSKSFDNWNRDIHVLIDEKNFWDEHWVKIWLSAFVYYCWLTNQNIENVFLESKIDNENLVNQTLLNISLLTTDILKIHFVFTQNWFSQRKRICMFSQANNFHENKQKRLKCIDILN